MKEKKKKEKKNTLPILCMVGPTSLWLLFFLLIPLIYVVVVSFLTKGAYGGVVGKFSIDSYKKIFDPLYLTVMWKSVVMAFETSVICLIISYPFAYMLCKVPDKIRGMLTLLIMLPFWVNGLIRLNGWSNILRDSGFVNTLLMKIRSVTPFCLMKSNRPADTDDVLGGGSPLRHGVYLLPIYGTAAYKQHIKARSFAG